MQYPSGRTVNYVLDSAGRINAVQNLATTKFPQQHYYASSITYTPASDVSSLAMGNGVTEQFSWNDRLQLTGITAGSLLSLSFYPCSGQAVSCSSGNTGSVQGQTIAAPGLTLTQSYAYDPLNRLATAQESGTWSQTWNYSNGNAYLNTYSGYTPQPFTPTVSSNFNSQNQLQIQSSSYDAAGNQKQIGGVGTSFDAEGRMLSVSLDGATINYVYDGEGQRVVKQTVSTRRENGRSVTLRVARTVFAKSLKHLQEIPIKDASTGTRVRI